MGVSGSGKTTVGKLLSKEIEWKYYNGDNYHQKESIEKMIKGIPLTDKDRDPWLESIRNIVEKNLKNSNNVIIECSALKQSYRDIIKQENNQIKFIYLKCSYELIKGRLEKRGRHFFNPKLLKSQFKILEEPNDALWIDASNSPKNIVKILRRYFKI